MKLKIQGVVLVAAVYKIKLLILTYEDGTSCPASLQINDNIYNYGEDELFSKLNDYINSEIKVIYSGFKNYSKKYIIEDIEDNTLKLKLKDINESII